MARGTKHPHPRNVGKMVSVLENPGSAEADRENPCESQAHKHNKNKLDAHACSSEKPVQGNCGLKIPHQVTENGKELNGRSWVDHKNCLPGGSMHQSFICSSTCLLTLFRLTDGTSQRVTDIVPYCKCSRLSICLHGDTTLNVHWGQGGMGPKEKSVVP